MSVTMPNFIWLFLVVPLLAGFGLGRLARRSWRDQDVPLLDGFVVDTAMGLGLLSLILFAMAASHHLRVVYTHVVCFLLAMIGLWVVVRAGVFAVIARPKDKNWPKPSWKAVVWILAFICLALFVLIPAMAPPSGSDWDSLAYHLSVPKLFLQHGGFYYIDFMSHSNFPMLVEMLYTPALSVNEPSGAKMVHYLYGVLLVLAVVMLVRKHLPGVSSSSALRQAQDAGLRQASGSRAAPLAALAIAGMPIVMWEATTAYIDLATALYTAIAVYLLLDYLDKPELRSLVWCGVAAGFAASTKMTGLALIPMLVVWLVVDQTFRRKAGDLSPGPSPGKGGELEAGTETGHYEGGKAGTETGHYERIAEVGRYGRVIKHALILAGVGLLVCSPWYIKSLIYTGNPVYPFFYSIFGGNDWTHELAQNYTASQARFGVGHDFASFVLLPFDLTFHSEKFYDTAGLFLGPILLVAVPLLFAARCWSRKLKGLLWFFFAQMVIWFVLTEQSRYLIPAFAILAVIIAAVAYSDERFRITRIALYIVFGATALFGVLVMSFMVSDTAPVVFGRETTDHYLSRTLPVYAAEKWINENTGDAKVALFGDTRGFYLDREYVWADWGHNKRFTREFASVDEFVSYLKGQGITHAMVNFRVLPGPASATGTAKLVYEAVDRKRFERVGNIESAVVGVYRIR